MIPAFGLNTPTLKYYIEILHNKTILESIKYSFYIALVSASLATILGTIICMIIIRLT